MPHWKVHIEGQVQGVGFRPAVAKLAHELTLSGEVCNTSEGVCIQLSCSRDERDLLINRIQENLPPLAVISRMFIEERPDTEQAYNAFKIVASRDTAEKKALVSPDFGMCKACQEDIQDPQNSRYFYPFTSCTQCGPRYSILDGVPYDRHRSTMEPFHMCASCRSEYKDPLDRRFHSQTNSCAACGVQLAFYPPQEVDLSHPINAVAKIVDRIDQGEIIGVKATGGFLLLADATNPAAVALLRARKRRPKKPLAVMVADTHQLEAYFDLTEKLVECITSPARPIVLCVPKKNTSLEATFELIAPGLATIGVCLPADPLLFLISSYCKRPIIASSGNVHHSPLEFDNDAAIRSLFGVADMLVYHNREIRFPQDDSVCRFTEFSGQRIVLRRSRGFAPTFWNSAKLTSEVPMLALGADLKSTFALWNDYNVYVSQHLGSLHSYDVQERFLETLFKFIKLIGIQPALLLLDRHPHYNNRSFRYLFPDAVLVEVPHHEAHFAALLWEHALLDTVEPVLGIVWDGLGYGDDGALWGGEFFEYREGDFERCFSFDYFDYLLGDKMSQEPRIAALSLCYEAGELPGFLSQKFSAEEWALYTKMLRNGNLPKTSSIGRLFDAIASILELIDKNGFEGEAAMLLENTASRYFKSTKHALVEPYDFHLSDSGRIGLGPIIKQVLEDKEGNFAAGHIAARFHQTLVQIILQVIQRSGCRSVGFSGGVFQNALLVDLLQQHVGERYRLLFHEQLSPNDENISLGQLAWSHIKNRLQLLKPTTHVFGNSR